MPRLAVQFELETPNALQQGQQAGRQFAQGFNQTVGSLTKAGMSQAMGWMQNMGPAARASMMAQLGLSTGNVITPPGLASPASKFQQMLNMGPLFPQQNRLKSLFLGLGVAPFSSWIGSRLLSDAAFGNGRSGGGHGGLLGAGGAGGFAEFFIGIEALKKAFEYGAEKIKQVVERGFDLYVKAGQLRTSVGKLFALQEAAKQVGLPESQIDQFMLRNNWGKARTSLQNFGVFSQLGGLSKDFQDAYKWASEIQGRWEMTASTTYDMQVQFDRIKTDWLTMWNDSGFLTGLDKMLQLTDKMLHNANKGGMNWLGVAFSGALSGRGNWVAAGILDQLQMMGANRNASSTAPPFNLKQSLPQMGAWEKMGFVIGSGAAPSKTESLLEKINAGITTLNITINGLKMLDRTHAPPAYVGASHNNLNPP